MLLLIYQGTICLKMKLEALILQCTNIGLIVVLMDRECKFQMLENNTIKLLILLKLNPQVIAKLKQV